MSNTLAADEVHTGTLRSNYYLSNGSPDISLVGTTSSSISCFGDALPGVSSISSHCRTGQEGALIATNRQTTEICLQNSTASRNIRLTGTAMNFGDIASPALNLDDTAVSILKNTTVSGNLGCNNVVSSSASIQGALHVSGQLSSTALQTVGIHQGIESTVGFARTVLTCTGVSSRGLIDFSYGGNQGNPYGRIEGSPDKMAPRDWGPHGWCRSMYVYEHHHGPHHSFLVHR